MSIAFAKADDVDRLVQYGEQFWTQTRYFEQGIAYDKETVTAMTHHLLDTGIVLYAEHDRNVVALMLVIVSELPMNRNYKMACEWVFYVDPKYRKGGLGAELILAAEYRLKDMGVRFFTMVALSNMPVGKIYERLGFEHSETSFTKDLGE